MPGTRTGRSVPATAQMAHDPTGGHHEDPACWRERRDRPSARPPAHRPRPRGDRAGAQPSGRRPGRRAGRAAGGGRRARPRQPAARGQRAGRRRGHPRAHRAEEAAAQARRHGRDRPAAQRGHGEPACRRGGPRRPAIPHPVVHPRVWLFRPRRPRPHRAGSVRPPRRGQVGPARGRHALGRAADVHRARGNRAALRPAVRRGRRRDARLARQARRARRGRRRPGLGPSPRRRRGHGGRAGAWPGGTGLQRRR